MRLRCFVAMAFGREDTDKIYDDLIAPTLREKGVTPVRVDRIDHTDDIDDRIIYELERCDLALADLTYARPSVYFEAGFAQRRVPVIYTCRKDHLSPRADDPFGNFRVHFDLQMKNIISWANTSDRRFAQRLARRISRVIAPLFRIKEAEERERREAEEFAALSLQDKTQRILEIAVPRLKRARYRGTCADEDGLRQLFAMSSPVSLTERIRIDLGVDPTVRLFDAALQLKPGWLGTKRMPGAIQAALIHVTPGLTKGKLKALRDGLLSYPLYDINPVHKTGAVERLLEHLFICTLRKVPPSRVLDALEDFRLGEEGKGFAFTGVQAVPPEGAIARHAKVYAVPGQESFLVLNPRLRNAQRRRVVYRVQGGELLGPAGSIIGRVTEVPRHARIYVLDDIKSESTFKVEFSGLLEWLERSLGK